MLQPIKLNEKMSLNRPVWTSESKTGMWDAHKHLHVSRMGFLMLRNFFVKTKGLVK